MNYDDLINRAIEKNEVLELLCGREGYEVEVSKFTSDIFPTDINAVLVNCFYKQQGKIEEIDKIFVEKICELLDGNAEEVYIAILYYDSCLFQEELGNETFVVEKELLADKIRKAIARQKQELKGEIFFYNGLKKKYPWKNIENFNNYYKNRYGISIIP